MPPQTKKVTLAGKLGAKGIEAAKKHAADPVKYGFTRLPPGINNGVCQVIDCKLEEFKADTNQKQADGSSAQGEIYLQLRATVLEPDSVAHNGSLITVKGLQTSKMVPILSRGLKRGDKILTMEDCIAEAQNELKKLGASEELVANVDAAVEAIAAAKPYFRLSTSESKPQMDPATGKPKVNPTTGKPYEPTTWENWNGNRGLENYQPNVGGGVDDGTPVDGQVDATGAATAVTEPASDVTYSDQEDLDALAVRADGGEDEAIEKLTDFAHNAGMDDEAISGYDSWTAVVEAMKSGGAVVEGETQEETQEEAYEPGKGDVVQYQLVDAKGQPLKDPKTKKVRKPIDVEVIAVNKAKQTVDLRNNADKKTIYKGVSWDAIIVPG